MDKIRERQLLKLRTPIRKLRYKSINPYSLTPYGIALTGGLIGYCGASLVQASPLGYAVSWGVMAIAGYCFGSYIRNKSVAELSLESLIYEELAAYDPMDKNALKKLQNKVRDGIVTPDDFFNWWVSELDIVRNSDSVEYKNKSEFLNKRIE